VLRRISDDDGATVEDDVIVCPQSALSAQLETLLGAAVARVDLSCGGGFIAVSQSPGADAGASGVLAVPLGGSSSATVATTPAAVDKCDGVVSVVSGLCNLPLVPVPT
jgi:hypothetical protein